MYKGFYINKQSGTYSETLEAFGVANLVSEILTRNNIKGYKVTIQDLGLRYLVQSNKPIIEEYLDDLTYFQVLTFIKKDTQQELPSGIISYFDYPESKAIQDEYKAKFAQIEKLKSDDAKKQARKDLNNEKLSEFGKRVDSAFDVYREIQGNINYPNFLSLFNNYSDNKENFKHLIKLIFRNYVEKASFLKKQRKQ